MPFVPITVYIIYLSYKQHYFVAKISRNCLESYTLYPDLLVQAQLKDGDGPPSTSIPNTGKITPPHAGTLSPVGPHDNNKELVLFGTKMQKLVFRREVFQRAKRATV